MPPKSTVSSTASSGGLIGLLTANAANTRLTSATAAGAIDPIRELGLDLEQQQYNTRLLALTKPEDYAKERQAAFNEMVVKIEDAYNDAYSGFINAGLPSEMAKRYALNAASNEKDVRRQVLETQFPSNANIIGEAQYVRKSPDSHMLGAGHATGIRRAPARKRATPRRRR